MSIGTTIRAIFVTRVRPDQGFWQTKDRRKHEELIGSSFSSLRLLQFDRPSQDGDTSKFDLEPSTVRERQT
jgi:hypothetical protein